MPGALVVLAKKCRQLTSSKVPQTTKKKQQTIFEFQIQIRQVPMVEEIGETVCSGRGSGGQGHFFSWLCLDTLLPSTCPSLPCRELVIKLLPISFCTFQISFFADTLCVCVCLIPALWQDCQIYIEMPGDYS